MDSLHLAIAMGPLSVYLLLLGAINTSRRAYVTSGSRDTAALGIGIGGFVLAGPLELLLPESTAFRLGAVAWLLLLAFYGMCLTLCVLMLRPRIVVYNVGRDVIRPLLAHLVADLDRETRWAGECLVLPRLGVQLHIETFIPLRVVQLIASGPQQSYEGWRRLEDALVTALRGVTASHNHHLGFGLLACGGFLLTIVAFCTLRDPDLLAHGLRDMLRLYESQ